MAETGMEDSLENGFHIARRKEMGRNHKGPKGVMSRGGKMDFRAGPTGEMKRTSIRSGCRVISAKWRAA